MYFNVCFSYIKSFLEVFYELLLKTNQIYMIIKIKINNIFSYIIRLPIEYYSLKLFK